VVVLVVDKVEQVNLILSLMEQQLYFMLVVLEEDKVLQVNNLVVKVAKVVVDKVEHQVDTELQVKLIQAVAVEEVLMMEAKVIVVVKVL
jgi:hypothetical protein